MGFDITATVERWPGSSVNPHRFNGEEFTRGGREVGHIHGTHQTHIPFPRRIRHVVVAEGLTSNSRGALPDDLGAAVASLGPEPAVGTE